MTGYPHSDDLVPEVVDEHTIVFLIRPDDAPAFTEEELDRLQAEHLTYLRGLARRGVLIANGPLRDQTDVRLRGVSVYAGGLDEALALANGDPMVRAGRLRIDAARWLTAGGTVAFGRALGGGASGSSSTTSPRDSTRNDATSGSQSSPSRHSQ